MTDTPALPHDLHYVDDSQPGIARKKIRGRFCYVDAQGQRIRDPGQIARIEALAVPPAYTQVWICSDPKGHLQATGRDTRGRKQYRYHRRWREVRDADKYERLLQFGQLLPKLRKALEVHLALPNHGREKIMATVITLLDNTLIRVGNARYARDNRSYGLTTLRNRHVEVKGNAIRFHFRGKSGIEHEVEVTDPRLARIVRRCLDLPGQQLFQYMDEQGTRRTLTSSDINRYLQEITGADFTAKDYRTWAGSTLAMALLREREWQPQTLANKQLVEVVKAVASELRNTPAVCRSCYIHPALLQAFAEGKLSGLPKSRARKHLRGEEVALLQFLQNPVDT
ncbi:MAG: DNA topoisomerase IB [Pseudomonadota bacterium]